MEQIKLQAYRRDETGKGAARRLRAQGLVPGVAYGLGKETAVLSVPSEALRDVLRSGRGANVLLDLAIEGIEGDHDTAAIIKEIQRHPISREALSVDLQWVSLKESITVEVAVVVEGSAPGVEEGGALETILHTVPVACLPTAIPEQLVIDIAGMEINDTRYVSDFVVPEGVEILASPEEAVVTIVPPVNLEALEARLEEEELVGVEVEGEEVEEVEEAEEEAAEGEEATEEEQ